MKFFAFTISIITLLVLSVVAYTFIYFNNPIGLEENIRIVIPPSESAIGALKIMNKNKLLKPSFLSHNALRVLNFIKPVKIYAGTYEFTPEMTNYQAFRKLLEGGKLEEIKVTFPEGISYLEFASIAKNELDADSAYFVELCKDSAILDKYGINAKNIEGFLLPETYNFFVNTPEEIILEKAINQGKKIWSEENVLKAKKVGLTPYQVITLASIVEAETPVMSEAPTVAGLYLNRLNKGMMLQADPTVQFAMGEKRRVLYKDLEIKNAYNTYQNVGLPPGPINNPGRNAILAVLNPEKHSYIFMVAKGDGSGQHNFAKSESEHFSNVAKYRANRNRN